MYNVYAGDSAILFTRTDMPCDKPDAVLDLDPSDPNGRTKVLEKLVNNKRVYAKYDNPAKLFDTFRNRFAPAAAAGGLVRNARGDSLMIFREGRWDLPKGHVDPGESYEQCALREVREECGLHNLHADRFLCETYHIYERDGEWFFKDTKWYAMTSDDVKLIPQTDEGIEKAEWVPAVELGKRLAGSYPTIIEVFEASDKTKAI